MSVDEAMNRPNPERTPYELMGGEAVLRGLVERFYALMDSEAVFAGIRALHPPSLQGSIDKLHLFLSGWLGGPPLYFEKHGHPMLRARHLPFAIGASERDQWLACMDRAMAECAIDPGLRDALGKAFFRTADHMRNRED